MMTPPFGGVHRVKSGFRWWWKREAGHSRPDVMFVPGLTVAWWRLTLMEADAGARLMEAFGDWAGLTVMKAHYREYATTVLWKWSFPYILWLGGYDDEMEEARPCLRVRVAVLLWLWRWLTCFYCVISFTFSIHCWLGKRLFLCWPGYDDQCCS